MGVIWNGAPGLSNYSRRFGAVGSAQDRLKFENRTESAVTELLKGDVEDELLPDFADFNSGLIGMLTRVFTGVGGGILAPGLQNLAGLFGIRWALVDQHTIDIEEALAAAQAANNRVDSLITGGTRTIYTSSTTWVKPSEPFTKIGVICIGSGGGGLSAQWSNTTPTRAVGGGYTYVEIPAANVPSTVLIEVPGATAKDNPDAQQAKFGTFVSSPVDGSGAIVASSGRTDANLSAPCKGQLGAWVNENGADSVIAKGGTSQNGSNGTRGEDAPVDGIDLTGGAAGGGGRGTTSGGVSVGTAYNGGGGGFPGGPGGAGGRFTPGGNDGGPGAQGLVAVIVF